MKHNMSVIEIRGIRGLLLAGSAICCLAVGFIGFPGWILMHIWNYAASFSVTVPGIGIFQGVLLWGIIIASYLIFKKDKLIVCVKSPKGLSEEELKSVFADLKEISKEDLILKSMIKARETELKLKNIEDKSNQEVENDAKIKTESIDESNCLCSQESINK